MKYVMLMSALLFSTSAFALIDTSKPVEMPKPEAAKPAEKLVPGCPDGMICVTPEQLELFVRQQIESAKLNELSNAPAIQSIAKQYQDLQNKKNAPPTPPTK